MKGEVAALAAGAVLAGCGGASSGPGDQSSRIEQVIRTTGSQQIAHASADYGVGPARILDASCVEQGTSQSYSCLAHYLAGGTRFQLSISASCDQKAACVWKADGPGVPQ